MTSGFDAHRLVRLQLAAGTRGYSIAATGIEERITYIVFRWSLQREFVSLDDLERWLIGAGVEVAS